MLWTGAKRYSTVLLALSLCAATALAAPTVQLPAPTGPFRVGTTTIDVSTERLETLTTDPGDHRRFVVQFWYPAGRGRCAPVQYMDAATSAAVAEDLPADFGVHVKVDACGGVPLARGGRLPLVLYSHGAGATRFGNTSLLTELASRGYLVAAIHHTYGSVLTVFTDGKAVPWNEDQWGTPEAARGHLNVWVDDARSTLDMIAEFDRKPGSLLHGRVDLARIAYVGHSMGGATAVAAALKEPRIRAAADLDGGLPPGAVPLPVQLPVPLLVLLSEPSQRAGSFATGEQVYLARIAGTTHTSFTDSAPIEAKTLTRSAVGDFLACTLRNTKTACDHLRATLKKAAVP
jgi:predicted dienelactone hydrolase